MVAKHIENRHKCYSTALLVQKGIFYFLFYSGSYLEEYFVSKYVILGKMGLLVCLPMLISLTLCTRAIGNNNLSFYINTNQLHLQLEM